MAETMSVRALGHATLARQGLLERREWTAVETVERLAGMQAQEARHPYAGLWSRVEGLGAEDLHDALQRGEVLRATWIRATLHLVCRDDYIATRAALQPVMDRAMGAIRDRSEHLDVDATLAAARELVDERPRIFEELRTELQQRFPKANERALGYVTRLHLPLAMVPTDDRWGFPRVAAFALAPTPDPAPDSRDLTRRYLHAFGPATLADFRAWSGLPGGDELLPTDAIELSDEKGRALYDLPDAERPREDAPAPPRLLPEFDNLVLAHADRARVVPDEHRQKVTTKNLRVRGTFLVDGIAAGTWTQKATKTKATLTLEPFAKLTARATKALTAEAERLLRLAEPDVSSYDVRVS